ncbi:LysR family transcriptional regulator [Actinomadura algeriensis]|uniref:DNA-binding transcriptional LysR family regulator n=1 Tax=Actinomadura algeriensis TaxID=1679523 RepID=A0ABR9K2C4_9ACTN|nr:LysR family transcriptional regulator [Actinomadura algeriensis]MBE1537011.1 DNA-binding transcriptional LysR family regulator [Actinomadura algeriensis]
MELRQMRYFVEVVRHGSLSAAAKTLHMSQPPLSTTIASLEKQLGVRLLERTGRGVVPTEAGRLLMERGEQIVRECDQLAEELQRHGAGLLGSLRLVAYMPYVQTLLPRVLAAYRQQAPSVDVQIFDMRPEEALAGLEHGNVDVALMTTSDHELSAKLNRAAVNMQPLGEVELVAVLPPRNIWPKVMAWSDLAAYPIFAPPVSSRFPGLGNLVLSELAQHAGVRPDVRTVNQHQAVLAQVSAGLGVAVSAQASTTSGPGCPISIRPLANGRRTLTMELVWPKERTLPESVTRFLSLAQAELFAGAR